MIEKDGDILLTRSEFMDAFWLIDHNELARLMRFGLPVKKIGNRNYYPKQAAHNWFAGGWNERKEGEI